MYLKSLYPDVPKLPPKNVYTYCFDRPERVAAPDHTFYIDALTGRTRSYREFRQRTARAMTALGAPTSHGGLGLCRENDEIVGILSENCIDYIVLCQALLALAVPLCPLSSYSTPFELASLLRQSCVTRLFVSPALLALARAAAKEVGLSDDCILLLEGSAPGRKNLTDLIDSVVARQIPAVGVRSVEKDTLAYLLFSSGTSGLPKAVMVSHDNLVFQLMQVEMINQESLAVSVPPDFGKAVVLGFLPLHHTFGFGYIILRPALAVSTIVIMPKWNADLALDVISKYKITRILMIPSIVLQLLEAQRKRIVNLDSLLSIGSGAAYLSPELGKRLSTIAPNVAVTQGYGMSEATLTVTTIPTDGILNGRVRPAAGSVGILWPGMEARILREDGSDADTNEPGDLLLRGRNVALGYWKNEKATKETFLEGGWLKTGDRLRADEHGNLFFEDRLKDTLKISGMQVSPTEIEDTLMVQPDKLIEAASVGGVSGGRTSDEKVPRAWVVLSEAGRRRGEREVIRVLDDWVKENLSKYKHLRGGIEIIDEIPTNPSGKVLRRVLQERYENRVKARL